MANAVLSAPHFQDEAAAFDYVEAKLWPAGPICPHCKNTDSVRIGRLNGKTTRSGLRKCYACKKPFTVRMGTIFESSHLPLHLWLQIIHLMCASKKGISTHQIQRMLRCSMKTAWFLGHRIRETMRQNRDLFTPPLGGAGKTVEGDETYVGRKASSRAYEAPAPKQAVMALVERGGVVRSFHVPNVTAQFLRPIIGRHAHMDSRFMAMSRRSILASGGISSLTKPSSIVKRNTSAAMSTPTLLKVISLFLSGASMASTNMFQRPICIGIYMNLIFDIPIG